MNACCGHRHGRFEEFSTYCLRPFWALVALTAGFWLLLAMEMLRRSRAGWRHEGQGEALRMIANDNGGDHP